MKIARNVDIRLSLLKMIYSYEVLKGSIPVFSFRIGFSDSDDKGKKANNITKNLKKENSYGYSDQNL